jgi:hypothetical protein
MTASPYTWIRTSNMENTEIDKGQDISISLHWDSCGEGGNKKGCVYVCRYVYMYVYMYVCMYVCMYKIILNTDFFLFNVLCTKIKIKYVC